MAIRVCVSEAQTAGVVLRLAEDVKEHVMDFAKAERKNLHQLCWCHPLHNSLSLLADLPWGTALHLRYLTGRGAAYRYEGIRLALAQ